MRTARRKPGGGDEHQRGVVPGTLSGREDRCNSGGVPMSGLGAFDARAGHQAAGLRAIRPSCTAPSRPARSTA
ncbi:MAG: hypothetical protein JWR32_4320 [Mycobacterium sp.]|jgi:hypothetical protein|nr:hypothetical protein [Mycobacterium sp.]